MSAQVRIEGVVTMKAVKEYQGQRKPKVTVGFVGGEISLQVPAEVFAVFPEEGSNVVVYCNAKCVNGEFGARFEQLKYAKHDGSGRPATGSARTS